MPDARFSTYSGAPSLQPSLASSTMDSSSNRSSTQQYGSRFSEQAFLAPDTIPEKGMSNNAACGQSQAAGGASSLSLSGTADSKAADIKSFAHTLDKMSEPRLDKQRYVMSGDKTDEVSKIALGAKLERALSRRMTGQDAVFTPKKSLDEKAFEAGIHAN